MHIALDFREIDFELVSVKEDNRLVNKAAFDVVVIIVSHVDHSD